MASKPKTDPNATLYNNLGADFIASNNLYNAYIPHPSLGRLDPTRSTETQNALNIRKAYADPNADSFAGKYDADTLELLNQYKSRLNPNSQNYAGRVSNDTQALLDQRKAASQAGYQRTNDMMDIVNRFKSGLEGYTAAENTAIREQGTAGLRSTAASTAAQNAALAARSGLRGASAMAQQRNDARSLRSDLNQFDQDLTVRNIDEKQNRLKDYSGFLSGLESDEFGRSQDLINSYQNLLQGTENTSYDRTAQALNDYASQQAGANDRFYARGQTAIGDYNKQLADQEEIERAMQTFNLGQAEKEQARDVGSVTSFVNLLNTIRNQNAQNEILKKK